MRSRLLRNRVVVVSLAAAAVMTLAAAAAVALLRTPVAAQAQASGVPVDLVLHNARVVTLDAKNSVVEAMAIQGDRIVATGTNAGMRALATASTKLVDAGGHMVVPGFADGHLHSKILGIGPGTVDLTPVRNMRELLDAIAAQIAKSAPGELITTTSDWHEAQIAEKRLPTRWDLDPISPNHPVVVVRGGHMYILNSSALGRFNITRDTPVPPGGKITTDAARGDITGELVDRARDLVPLPPVPERELDERLRLLREEHRRLNSLGLTSFRNPGTNILQFKDYQELWRRSELTIRISTLIRPDRGASAEQVARDIASWAILGRFGNPMLRFDGIKLGVDGGYEGGWMTRPYEEPHGEGGTYFGLNTMPREPFMAIVRALNRLDIRPSAHAVGDAAVELVLDAYEAAHRERSIVGRRWSIEHAFITRPDQIDRIKRLGMVVSAQSHLYLAAPSLLQYWGRQRTEDVAPVRAWLDAGIPVASGTDNKLPYVPEDPLLTFYHWVTRDTLAGVLGRQHAISRSEALRIASYGNAYLTFEENVKGTIEPGKLADLVVVSEDLLSAPPERLRRARVLATMVGGTFVHQAPSWMSESFAGRR